MPARAYRSRSQAREDSSSEEETPLISPRPRGSRKPLVIRTSSEEKGRPAPGKKKASTKKAVDTDSSSDEAPTKRKVYKPKVSRMVVSSSEDEVSVVTPARKVAGSKVISTNAAQSTRLGGKGAMQKKPEPREKSPGKIRKAEMKEMPPDALSHIARFLNGDEQVRLLQTSKRIGEVGKRLRSDFSNRDMYVEELRSLKRKHPSRKVTGIRLKLSEGEDLNAEGKYLADLEKLIIIGDDEFRLADLSFLESCPELRELTIKGCLNSMVGIKSGGKLRKLELHFLPDHEEKTTLDLAELNALEELVELHIEPMSHRVDLHVEGTLRLPSLRKLTLRRITTTEEFLIEECPVLTELELDLEPGGHFGFFNAELPLRKLKLTSGKPGVLNTILVNYKGLTSLTLEEEARIKASSLSFLKVLSRLEYLVITSRRSILWRESDSDLFSYSSKLEHLVLNSSEGVIPSLGNCTRLKQLQVVGSSGGKGKDFGPTSVSALPRAGSLLESIELMNVVVDGAIFEEMVHLPHLENFSLDANLAACSNLDKIGELSQLKSLVLKSRAVKDIKLKLMPATALKKFKRLETLNLPFFPGKDLTCLSNSKALTKIEVSFSELISLDGSKELSSLKSLTIINSHNLRDCSDISFCTGLEDVTLLGCSALERFILPASETRPNLLILHLGKCPSLREFILETELASLQKLTLNGCPFTKIEGLSHCVALSELKIEDHRLDNSNFLPALAKISRIEMSLSPEMRHFRFRGGLPSLKFLRLAAAVDEKHESISRIEGFDKCPNLEYFTLQGTSIKEVDTLSNCVKLREVKLDRNELLRDISGLSKCKDLQSLDIYRSTQLKDLTPLRACTQLTSLAIRKTGVTKHSFQTDLPDLNVALFFP